MPRRNHCNRVYLMKREESPPVVWNNLATHLLMLIVTTSATRPTPSKPNVPHNLHLCPRRTLPSLLMNNLLRGSRSSRTRSTCLRHIAFSLETPSHVFRSGSIVRRTKRRPQPVQRRPLEKRGC